MRRVHAEGLRERRNVREAPRADSLIHRCRSCNEAFDESHETCPDCGYSDEHGVHGATLVEVES